MKESRNHANQHTLRRGARNLGQGSGEVCEPFEVRGRNQLILPKNDLHVPKRVVNGLE